MLKIFLIPILRTKTVSLVKEIADKNYWAAKQVYKARLWRNSLRSRHDPILVYSMGKVGSTSVARSLDAVYDSDSIHHLHWLVPEKLNHDEKLTRSFMRRFAGTPLERKFWPEYIWTGQFLSKQVHSRPGNTDKWKIITLVRDPVARNISAFFQNLKLIFEYDYQAALRTKTEAEVVDELWELFKEGYITREKAFRMDCNPLTWFDNELNQVFDIDIFSQRFPVNQGYNIYETPTADILVMKLEDLKNCASNAVNQFLGLKHFKLKSGNVAEDKEYSSLYSQFLERVKLPDDYLDKVYQSRVCKHFYTDDELAEFRNRWSEN